MEKTFLMAATINGFLAVALGAFGAHGLHKRLAGLPDKAVRLDWWETAAHYHLTYALALGLMAYLSSRSVSLPKIRTTQKESFLAYDLLPKNWTDLN